MKYIEVFWQGMAGYANYLWNEITQPSWHNYFYWLVGISLFVWALEIGIPWRKNQAIIRKDFYLDVFYMFFNFFLFSLIGYNAVSNVGVTLFSDFLALFGVTNLVALNVATWPLWGKFLLMFLLRDFIQWNVHRLLHKIPWMWEFHKVHHSVEEMGFAAHLRYHWMETVIYRFFEFLPLTMIGFGLTDFFWLHIFTVTIGHFNHANVYLPVGPLKYIFNTPQMHLWHHIEKLPEGHPDGINYGISLSLWDYLFGTAVFPKADSQLKLGFSNLNEFPKTLWDQLRYPWIKK